MRYSSVAASLPSAALAASLADLCTVSNVKSALPSNGTLLGIELIPSSVTASVYTPSTSNSSSSTSGQTGTSATNSSTGAGAGAGGGPGGSTTSSYPYCNVTVTYSHPGKAGLVNLKYAFPDPSSFKNRFYVAGGGGYSLSSDPTGGLAYGAAGGATDAGYNGFETSFDEVILAGNGSIDWDATYMFAYQALGELTIIGKPLTTSFYSSSSSSSSAITNNTTTKTNSSKLFTYFEGCSDGGREGMSQVQRYGAYYDGVIAGAPAFRTAQQQTNHVFSSLVEQTLDYFPPPCELDKIVNVTITACDPLDGRTDGVVSRTDLCQLHFNLSSIVGERYYCAAENSTSLGFGFNKRKRQAGGAEGSSTSYQPAQNGSVSEKGVAVAQAIYNGLHNLKGQRAYLSWQIAAQLEDAVTQYDANTSSWTLDIPSIGGSYVTKFVDLEDVDNLSSLENVTYDTMVQWMTTGFYRYLDSLQSTLPDLSPFEASGGKLLHYHGESDPSVPTASSVHYWQSVREIMYGRSSHNASLAAMKDWYQLYLVPGAAHCGVNALQPGPYPEDNMNIMINWVENGIRPARLNATVSSGRYAGETQMLCQWPTRPLWHGNSSSFDCVHDKKSIESWTYEFPAFKLPVY